MKVHSLIVVFLLVMSPVQSNENKLFNFNALTHQKPSIQNWEMERGDYSNVTFFNWSTQSSPKKEFSVAIEISESVDIHSNEFFEQVKKRMPTARHISQPEFTNQFGKEAMVVDFSFGKESYPGFAKYIGFDTNGHLYEIFVSRYRLPIEEDQELMTLINSIKIKQQNQTSNN